MGTRKATQVSENLMRYSDLVIKLDSLEKRIEDRSKPEITPSDLLDRKLEIAGLLCDIHFAAPHYRPFLSWIQDAYDSLPEPNFERYRCSLMEAAA
jgi:hypothetical protein